MVRDEFHLEKELSEFRARRGSNGTSRQLPCDAEFEALAQEWTRNVRHALRFVRGMTVTREECRALGEEMALLFIAATQERSADEAQKQRRQRIQDDICERLRHGASKAAAAAEAGISRETLHQWERKDPSLRWQVRNARAQGLDVRANHSLTRTKMRPAVLQAIIAALAAGMTRAQAIADAGVSKQTFYTWLHRAPDFRGEVLAAEERAPSH